MAIQIAEILSVTHAQEILESRTFAETWSRLLKVVGSVQPPLRDAGPFTDTGRPKTPKRQVRSFGGQKKFCLFPIHQKQWNRDLDTALRDDGWDRQPFAITGEGLGKLPTLLKGDFHKRGVFVEVEFGNAASFHRDLFKFHIAGRSGSGSVGVAIVLLDRLARFADQGLTTYEQARNLLPYIQISLGLPIAVVGITLDDFDPVRARYQEMEEVASQKGVECHPFDRVYGLDQVVELDESISSD